MSMLALRDSENKERVNEETTKEILELETKDSHMMFLRAVSSPRDRERDEYHFSASWRTLEPRGSGLEKLLL